MPKPAWDSFVSEIRKKKYMMTVREISEMLKKEGQRGLDDRMKEFLFESFKAHRNVEDNPDDVNDRLVNIRDLVSSRLTQKNRKIDDLIAIQREKDNARDDIKLQGLKQVNAEFLLAL